MSATWRSRQRLLLWLCGGSALLAAGFAGTAGHVDGFLAAQAFSRHLPPLLWESLTVLGDERALLALFLPFCWRYPRLFWGLLLAAAIAGLACRGIKVLVHMPRPASVLAPEQILVIGQRLTRHSMPAGHAASLFAFAGTLLGFLGWRRTWPVLALAAAAGFSRVAVGAHWPADVAVGALIGLLGAWAALWAIPRWDWGIRPRSFPWLVGVAAVAVATLLLDSQGYPDSLPLRAALSLWALAGLLAQYLRRRPGRHAALRA